MTVIATDDDTDVFTRDGKGRPLILHPETGKVVAYTRISTFASTLTSKYLSTYDGWWGMRAYHLFPEQARMIATAPDQKGQQKAMDSLLQAAGKHEKRDTGQRRHTRVRQFITKSPLLPALPDDAYAELQAVADTVRSLGTITGVEVPLVFDDWRVAGSADYVGVGEDGRPFVADLKTGDSRFGNSTDIEWCLQLVAYSKGHRWEHHTQTRGEKVCPTQPRLYIIHAPQSSGSDKIRIYEYDPAIALTLGGIAANVLAARDIHPLIKKAA